jgi:hypothetical protein
MYRTVSNYGYGDKTWTNRFLSLREIVEHYKNVEGWNIEQIRLAYRESDFIHYWEDDNENDVEDWDWQNS